jgi:hypothetical protein
LKMLGNVAFMIGFGAYLLGSVNSSVCWLQRRTSVTTLHCTKFLVWREIFPISKKKKWILNFIYISKFRNLI